MDLASEIVDQPGFKIKFGDNMSAELVIKEGVVFDDQVARECKTVLEERGQGNKFFVLVSSEGFFRVTRKARKLGASKNFSSHLSAVAFYTSNSSLALLGELYNKINKPAVPTRVFSSRESAEEWLKEQVQQQGAA